MGFLPNGFGASLLLHTYNSEPTRGRGPAEGTGSAHPHTQGVSTQAAARWEVGSALAVAQCCHRADSLCLAPCTVPRVGPCGSGSLVAHGLGDTQVARPG